MRPRYFAILLFLFGAGCAQKPSGPEIYKTWYQPYLEYQSFQSENEDLEKQLNKGLQLYLKKDYQGAFEVFSSILEIYSDHQITASFYTALCLMEMEVVSPEQKTIVESMFQDVIKQGRNPFVRQAAWYLALFYFKNSDDSAAIPILEVLAHDEGIYKEEAGKLLEKVK